MAAENNKKTLRSEIEELNRSKSKRKQKNTVSTEIHPEDTF
jgi:hypothetical protein